MNYYRQSIVIFGFVMPFLLCAVAIGACFYAIGNFQARLKIKQAEFKTNETLQVTMKQLEKEIGSERPHLERWTEELSKETASSVSNNLRRITGKLPPKEIVQTAFEPSASKGGFGSASAQKSSLVKVAFRGTYRTLQRTLLELESLMPQLHIVEMKIDPINNENSMINMQVTYTVWEN
jgi:hypothetical protein